MGWPVVAASNVSRVVRHARARRGLELLLETALTALNPSTSPTPSTFEDSHQSPARVTDMAARFE